MSEQIEVDPEKLRVAITIIVLLSVIITGGIIFWYVHHLDSEKAQCAANPSLRYAQKCTTQSDCIQKCAEHLHSAS